MQEKIYLLAKKIKAAGKTVVFTGAGISTESGTQPGPSIPGPAACNGVAGSRRHPER